ncbi:hypothetical protein AB0F45_39180, partial [Streptomyces achromogenes]
QRVVCSSATYPPGNRTIALERSSAGTARRLADDLGVAPGDLLLRARRAALSGEDAGRGRGRAGAA